VIDNDTYLDSDHFSYFTRSHFDFLVTTPDAKPFMAIEYDGPFHSNPEQIARDVKKNFLCKEAGYQYSASTRTTCFGNTEE